MMATSNKPHIPLSKLRDMWGMAKRSYATYDPDTRDRFQSLVADEVQRRRVKALEAELAALRERVAAKPLPDGVPEAMAERDAARAALAWVQTWQEQEPNANGLLPCPFCGDRDTQINNTMNSGYIAFCIACDGQVGDTDDPFSKPEYAIAAWNRRTPAPQQPARTIPENLSEQRLVSISANTLAALECVLEGVDTEACRVIMRLWLDRAWSDYNEQQPAMPQAEWSQAPEWAMWWAVDDSGQAYWFDSKPYILGEMGWVTRSLQQAPDKVFPQLDWRQTLQARPTAQEVSGEANEESD